jgi:hypothetical protein
MCLMQNVFTLIVTQMWVRSFVWLLVLFAAFVALDAMTVGRSKLHPEAKTVREWLGSNVANLPKEGVEWINALFTKYSRRLHKRQLTKRERKEYRTLSDVERDTFHRALNKLKADTVWIVMT